VCRKETVRQEETTAEEEMTLLLISIPFMVLGFAIAIVPLLTTMRREHALEDEHLWRQEERQGHVTDPYARFASLDEYLVEEDDRELMNVA
jgi:hypothetical protein